MSKMIPVDREFLERIRELEKERDEAHAAVKPILDLHRSGHCTRDVVDRVVARAKAAEEAYFAHIGSALSTVQKK